MPSWGGVYGCVLSPADILLLDALWQNIRAIFFIFPIRIFLCSTSTRLQTGLISCLPCHKAMRFGDFLRQPIRSSSFLARFYCANSCLAYTRYKFDNVIIPRQLQRCEVILTN